MPNRVDSFENTLIASGDNSGDKGDLKRAGSSFVQYVIQILSTGRVLQCGLVTQMQYYY